VAHAILDLKFLGRELVLWKQSSYLKYSKNKLNKVYLHEKQKRAILDAMEGISWKW
jgi:hypothetical protein